MSTLRETPAVTSRGVTQWRLSNHLLAGEKRKHPDDVVAWLGAIQAQDFSAAKWAVGLRMDRATDAEVEQAFNDGAILRTHIMRPTWHFVVPRDIRSVLALTAPRVHAANARRYRELGLDGRLLSRCHAVFAKALRGGNYLTRPELAEHLRKHRIDAAGQRLAYMLMHAELEALICSGPRRGRQFTYALLDERAPQARTLRRDDALAGWALRYFVSHGPAQVKDFGWWSGLSAHDAKRGLELVEAQLAHATVDGRTYWLSPKSKGGTQKERALLLSIYDEYTIAYRDRGDLGEARRVEKLLSMGNALTSVLILDGKIAGTWKRIIRPREMEIRTTPFTRLRRDENAAVKAAAIRYGAFLEMPRVIVT